MARPSSSTNWKKKVELEARKSLLAGRQFWSTVYCGEKASLAPALPHKEATSPGHMQPNPRSTSPPAPHLLEVEGEEDEGPIEQREQGAVEDAQPDHGLRGHRAQDVLGDKELLLLQPGMLYLLRDAPVWERAPVLWPALCLALAQEGSSALASHRAWVHLLPCPSP